MVRKRTSVTLSIIMMASALMLGACSATAPEQANSSSKEDAADTASQKPEANKKDQSVTFSIPMDIGTENPHMYLPTQMFAQAMLYEPLVDYNVQTSKIVPRLAESWDISQDGKEYTFHLRNDVKYSDGSVFNADSVIKNFSTVLANKKAHSWLGSIQYITSVDKVDDSTVKITLNAPYGGLLQELAFVRPFRFLADAGFPDDGNTAKGIKAPIGTGPWVLTEYKKDEEAVFTRNEKYWGTKPKVEKVVMKVIPDASTAILAFEKKELDMLYGVGVINLDDFQQLKDSGKYGTETSEPIQTRNLIYNTAKGPASDLKVRQAIQYAVNKKAMVESVTHGTEPVADTILAKNFPYADLDLQPIEYNVEQANKLLDEAGWTLPAGKTVREKDGNPLSLQMVYWSSDSVQKAMTEVIQGELAKVGIQVAVKGEETSVANNRLIAGDYDLYFWMTYGAPLDPLNLVTSIITPTNGFYEAQTGLPDKQQIDEKGKQVMVETDEAKKQQLYSDILTMLHKDAAYYPISYQTVIAVYQKNLAGMEKKSMSSKYDFPLGLLEMK